MGITSRSVLLLSGIVVGLYRQVAAEQAGVGRLTRESADAAAEG